MRYHIKVRARGLYKKAPCLLKIPQFVTLAPQSVTLIPQFVTVLPQFVTFNAVSR